MPPLFRQGLHRSIYKCRGWGHFTNSPYESVIKWGVGGTYVTRRRRGGDSREGSVGGGERRDGWGREVGQ